MRTLALLFLVAVASLCSAQNPPQKKNAGPAKKAPAAKAPSQPADVAAQKFGGDGKVNPGFAASHAAFVEIAKKGEAQVVFLGDSITAGWGRQPEIFGREYGAYKAANFGIGGDRTQHVLWRVENGEFEGIKPKAAVLMIGTNNAGIADNPPEQVAAGIRKIVQAIHARSPETKVLLLAIFPRGPGEENNPGRAKNKAVNAIIAGMHDGKKVHYLDIGPKFLAADGTLSKDIMPDLLHLNAKGYQIWADAIRDKLSELAR
ncbi:MAG: platelet-activating factor acetylhydrolase IB subunit [Opitutales bacterium]